MAKDKWQYIINGFASKRLFGKRRRVLIYQTVMEDGEICGPSMIAMDRSCIRPSVCASGREEFSAKRWFKLSFNEEKSRYTFDDPSGGNPFWIDKALIRLLDDIEIDSILVDESKSETRTK